MEREIKDLENRVDDHETRIIQVESQIEGLDGRVGALEKWLPILIQDNKDTLKMVNEQYSKMDGKIDRTLDKQEAIVKDASERVPKWIMWLYVGSVGIFVTAVIGVGAWVVETLLKLH